MGFQDSSVHCLRRDLDLSLNPQLRKTQNQPPASSSLGHSPPPPPQAAISIPQLRTNFENLETTAVPLQASLLCDSEPSNALLGLEVPGLQPGPKASDCTPLCGGSLCPSRHSHDSICLALLHLCPWSLAQSWARATIHTCQTTSPLQSLLSLKYILSLLPGQPKPLSAYCMQHTTGTQHTLVVTFRE